MVGLLMLGFERPHDWYGYCCDSLDWLPPRLDGLGAHVVQVDRFFKGKGMIISARWLEQ